MFVLQVTERGKTREIEFLQSAVLVGSNATNGIVLADSQVSGHHALLYLEETGASIFLLGSDTYTHNDDKKVG